MTEDIIPQKRCTKCGQEYPATSEYFHKNHRRNAFISRCKKCRSEDCKQHREKFAEHYRDYRKEHAEHIAEYQREYRPGYKRRNPEKRAEYLRNYKKQNADAIAESSREYRRRNAEKRAEYNRQYHRQNPHIGLAEAARRRARKRALPDTWTKADWQRCLDYWHGCCAVCGYPLKDIFESVEPHADHWIPLTKKSCPGTVPGNMICLCDKCNHGKFNKLPADWLIFIYGKAKAKVILQRIEAYFESVKRH